MDKEERTEWHITRIYRSSFVPTGGTIPCARGAVL